MVAWMVPSLVTVNDGAGVLSNSRFVVPRKLLPVKVITSSPAVDPVD